MEACADLMEALYLVVLFTTFKIKCLDTFFSLLKNELFLIAQLFKKELTRVQKQVVDKG